MHDFQLLREVHHHVVRVEEGRKGAINNLGSVGSVGADIGQQQTGPEWFILFFYFWREKYIIRLYWLQEREIKWMPGWLYLSEELSSSQCWWSQTPAEHLWPRSWWVTSLSWCPDGERTFQTGLVTCDKRLFYVNLIKKFVSLNETKRKQYIHFKINLHSF